MMITTMKPRKIKAMAIHSLHFPNKVLLQELQGLFWLAWKAEGDCDLVFWFQQACLNT